MSGRKVMENKSSINGADSFVTRKTFFASLGMVSLFCVLCVLTGAFFLSAGGDQGYGYIKERYADCDSAVSGIKSGDIPVLSSGFGFVIKAYNDNIGIFDSSGKELIEVLDIKPESLSKGKRERLYAGYTVESVAELICEINTYIGG